MQLRSGKNTVFVPRIASLVSMSSSIMDMRYSHLLIATILRMFLFILFFNGFLVIYIVYLAHKYIA